MNPVDMAWMMMRMQCVLASASACITTGKTGTAVQPYVTVRLSHGKESFAVRGHGDARQRRVARQIIQKAHGKEKQHGRRQNRRTAKNGDTANKSKGARQRKPHGSLFFAVCLFAFSFFPFVMYLF